MMSRTTRLATSMIVAFAAIGMAAQRAHDYVVECGRLRVIVSDRGYLRAVDVGGKRMVESLGLQATCGDPAVKGRGRVSQACTYWQSSHDVSARGVDITRDAAKGQVVVEREGILAFDREELGPDWTDGTFAESAKDRHTKELVAAKGTRGARIQDGVLDLRVAGGRGKCTALARRQTIPARCALCFDLNLKGDDTIGKTQHSIFLRSHSDPGECLCMHVDTRRQFFFFEVKHKGRWTGEKLYYYPFAFT